MSARAKVFMSGNSQAVRLPREFRLDVEEVEIQRQGNRLVLTPVGEEEDPWANLKAFWAAGGFSEDFMKDGRDQGEFTENPALDDLFK